MASRPTATVWETTNPGALTRNTGSRSSATIKTFVATTTPAEYAVIHVHAFCMTELFVSLSFTVWSSFQLANYTRQRVEFTAQNSIPRLWV